MSQSVSLTFPDGSVRSYDAGATGRDVAESISKSLAKKAVAMTLDGKLRRDVTQAFLALLDRAGDTDFALGTRRVWRGSMSHGRGCGGAGGKEDERDRG